MSRVFRSLAALAAIFAFLFAQAAASAYACSGPVPDLVAMAQMRADNEGDGGLCEKHCASATAVSFDVAQAAVPQMPAIGPAPLLRVEIAQPPAMRTVIHGARLSVAGPAPPFDRFTVLRI